MIKIKNSVFFLFSILLICTCLPVMVSAADGHADTLIRENITIDINRDSAFQTIDGFGFFGAQSVWWSSATALFSKAWADQVIGDLGISIWRNEYYPPVTSNQGQDATWEKQLPVVKGLQDAARKAHVKLKYIFTVWSPPAALKCEPDTNKQPQTGVPHQGGTRKGGMLDPARYTEFGNWLADGIQLYKDAGIDVFAVSPQNEPLFKQDFNSCYYNPIKWYGEMIKRSMPLVKARFPQVKIFGSENMLEMEAGKHRQSFYAQNLIGNKEALDNLDIWAVHGYQEGITPTAGEKLAKLWGTFHSETAATAKPVWMTETSGYTDNWKTADGKAGAIDLASDIQSALVYGKASAWLWWQGSDQTINEYSLMAGLKKGKKYFVSKHFYRFIRPGSKMVGIQANVPGKVFASAFENAQMKTFTIELINTSGNNIQVQLAGKNIPDDYDYYVTTSDPAENCVKKEKKVHRDAIWLPASSVVTLVNGNVYERN